MIISETNKIKERKEELEKLKKLLEDLELPENYCLDEGEYGIKLMEKWKFLGFMQKEEVASFYLDENIKIVFESAEDLEKIKPILQKSTIKFKVEVGTYF